MKHKWLKKYKFSKILITSFLLIPIINFPIFVSSCSNNSDDVSTLPTPPSSGSTQTPGTPSLPSGGESTPTPEPTPTPPSSGGGTTSPVPEPTPTPTPPETIPSKPSKATKVKSNIVINGIEASNPINNFTPIQLKLKKDEVINWIISNQNKIFDNYSNTLNSTTLIINFISESNLNSASINFTITNATLDNGSIGKYTNYFNVTNLQTAHDEINQSTELWPGVEINGINATLSLANLCDYEVIISRKLSISDTKDILPNWIIENAQNIFQNYDFPLTTSNFHIDNIESNGPNSIIVQIYLLNAKEFENNELIIKPKLFYLQINNLRTSDKEIITSRPDFNTNFIRIDESTIIVNPWTNNDEIKIRYGTFPINLCKEDDQITIDDLVQSIDLMNLYKIPTSDFGCRNIKASDFAIAFTKWLTSHWKYFPTFSWDNPAGLFNVKGTKSWSYAKNNPYDINEKTWYIKESVNQKWGRDWNFPNQRQYDMVNFITRFLSGIDPNMNDIDKLIYSLFFTTAWVDYTGSNDVDGSVYGPITYHVAVCMNYALTLSFLLNLANVPSIPMTVAFGKKGQDYPNDVTATVLKHALSWVYLDPDNSGEKKWYSCDPTFFDSFAAGGGISPYFSTFRMEHSGNFTNALFCNTLVDEFTVANEQTLGSGWANSQRWQQSNYNIYWGMPFGEVYMEEYKNKIGQAAIGLFDLNNGINKKPIIYKSMHNLGDECRVKPQFYNGKYYFIKGNKVYTSALFENESNWTDVTNSFFGNLDETSKQEIFKTPMIGKINNYFIFNQDDKKIRIHNMQLSDWTQDKILEIPYNITNSFTTRKIWDITFDLDGTVNFTGSYRDFDAQNKTYFKVVKHKYSDFNIYKYCNDQGFDNNSKILAKWFYEWLGGFIQIKTNKFDYGIDKQNKVNYYKIINQIMNTNYSVNETINRLTQNYNLFLSNINNELNSINFTSKNLQKIYINTNDYNSGGKIIFPLNCWINPYSLINENFLDFYKYDIYYSQQNNQNKSQYQPLFIGLDKPEFNKNISNAPQQNPDGYYYIKAYLKNNPNICIESSIVNVVSTSDFFYEYYPQTLAEEGVKLNLSFTNYTFSSLQTNYFPKIPNWYEQNVRLELKCTILCFDFTKYKIEIKMHHIINNQDNIIEIFEPLSNGNVDKTFYKTSNDHGIYYLEFVIKDKKTQNITQPSIYSKATYIFNKNDIEHFNLNNWNIN